MRKSFSIPTTGVGKKLPYPHVPAEAPKFSRSVVAGNLIFVSGCEGLNDRDGRLGDRCLRGADDHRS